VPQLTHWPTNSKQYVFMKGAVERIFDACSHVQLADGPAPLDDKMQEEILANVEALAEEGLRVLGFASKPWDGASSSSGEQADRGLVEKDLVLYGLQGLYDPPRPETKASVKECHQAGIQVHMLTVGLPSLPPSLSFRATTPLPLAPSLSRSASCLATCTCWPRSRPMPWS
jgi:magnesium-transporting ATPase (P-type)